MPHLSLAEKVRVVTLLEEGWLERRVAVRFNIARSTVHNKKMWNERQSFERQVGSGRPRISTEIDDVNLIQVTEAHNETNFPGSLRTARRRVKEGSELRNHPAVKKPFLTQQKNTE
jgi:transposase